MEELKEQLKSNFEEHKAFMGKLDDLKTDMMEIKLQIAELPKRIFDESDKKYASKIAERIIYGMVGAISLSALYAMLKLISYK